MVSFSDHNDLASVDVLDPPRFLSRQDCEAFVALLRRHFTDDRRYVFVDIRSRWTGNIRWARNRVITSGDTRNSVFKCVVNEPGASSGFTMNQVGAASIQVAVDYIIEGFKHWGGYEYLWGPTHQFEESEYAKPNIWSDYTFALDAASRTAAAQALAVQAERVGMLSAGYIQVAAKGAAVFGRDGLALYFPYTEAQYSVTVRDPAGTGSGWAGVDWSDWRKIDTERLTATALDKCLASRNPVAIEPGRYTAILEPQAVSDLVTPMFAGNRKITTTAFNKAGGSPFFSGQEPKFGQQIIDNRLIISTDPMDPELGYVPFNPRGEPYRAVRWIEDGVLRKVPKTMGEALRENRTTWVLNNPSSYRLSGGTVPVEEMIATTERGLLVTRFHDVVLMDKPSWLCSGYTRDGLWLIEKGKISKPVKNFRFTESPMFALNNVEQLGVPQRVFHPECPVVVPPLKARDFSFTSLSDAV